MDFIAFNVNRSEGASGTQIFASAASDATLGIDCGNFRRIGILGVRRNHLYGGGGTMTGAVSAFDAAIVDFDAEAGAVSAILGKNDAILFNPYRPSDLNRGFFGFGYFPNCSVGTNFGTFCAFGTTKTAFVRHFGLHESLQIVRRTQYLIRANRHAKLTCGTMLRNMT